MSEKTIKFGAYIKNIRLQRKMSLSDVGRAINRSKSWVCELEHGTRGEKIDPLVLIQLGNYLNVSITAIFEAAGYDDTLDIRRASVLATHVNRTSQADIGLHRAISRELMALREVSHILRELAKTDLPALKQHSVTIEEITKKLETYLLAGGA